MSFYVGCNTPRLVFAGGCRAGPPETNRKLFGRQFDVYFMVPAKYLAEEGGGAARSSTSFQVFQCDNNILARAIMSQKSPYSDVITNIFPSSEVNILWHRTLQHGVFLFTSWDESMHHLNFHHNSQHGGWKTCPPVLNKENTKNPTRMSFTSH